jgi:hypothetical protein
MDIFDNPFWILGATLRDNRRRIMELAEEKSLLEDEDLIRNASSILTHPRRRLEAEVAWLPGIGPKRAQELVALLQSDPDQIPEQEGIPSLAMANLLVGGLKSKIQRIGKDDLPEWIVGVAEAYDKLDVDEALSLINEERDVSGFPQVADHHALEDGIESRRQHFKAVIRETLNQLDSSDLVEVITNIVEESTEMGVLSAPQLIDDLVDTYEVEAQEFLDREEENIDSLLDQINSLAESRADEVEIGLAVDRLVRVAKNWDAVAQPVQVSTKSRGLGHEASSRVAGKIRSVAVDLFNNYGELELSQQLTSMLQEVFAEVVAVADQAEVDADALDRMSVELAEFQTKQDQQEAEWKQELTYSIDIGAVFKERFSISPDGVQWKGKTTPLEKITRIRWGGTSHSVNGIPSGTNYTVVFGTDTNSTSISIRKTNTYDGIVQRLWKGAGVQILINLIENLKTGATVEIGGVVVADAGVQIRRKKFLGTGEFEFCKWSELQIWTADGSFCIGKENDKKVRAALPYQETDNVHILEFAIRHKFEKPGLTLSAAFQ